MKIAVCEEDIAGAGYGLSNNPLTRAVRRTTKQRWVVIGGAIACRLGRRTGIPRCVCVLPFSVLTQWRIYRCLKVMQPFEFELDIDNAAPRTSRSSNTVFSH